MSQDKQLRGVTLEAVLKKRRLEQALNAKEFAVLAGISYSSALEWFRVPGFPVFRGFIFWQDFAEWRRARVQPDTHVSSDGKEQQRLRLEDLPPRAARILLEDR